MEQINYEKYLEGMKPPEDLIDWVIKSGALSKEYLIYRNSWEYNPLEDRREKAVEVVCSCCGKKFTAARYDAGGCHNNYPPAPFGWWNPMLTEAVICGYDTKCPVCGADATAKHISNMKHRIRRECYVTQIVRLPVPGKTDRLVLLEWEVSKCIFRDGSKSYGTHLWEAYVVEEKKVVRLKGWTRCMSTISYHHIEQKKTFMDDYGHMQMLYPFDDSVLDGTTGENCKINRFISQGGQYLVAYLAVWRKHANMENLIMQGCGKLVDELIKEEQHVHTYERNKCIPKMECINWKEVRPHKMLNLSKEEFRQYGSSLSKKDYKMIGLVRGAGISLDIGSQLKLLRRHGEWSVEYVIEQQPKELFWKIMKYVDHPGRDYSTLRDYWNMAGVLGMDLENQQVRWPKELKAAHDRVTKAYNKRRDELRKEDFIKRREVLEQLEWHCDGLLIRPCATQDEMRQEGKVLHHCVARYAEDHALGRTAIFLIRLESEPEKPFYTLEWDEKKCLVRQNRGKHNCARTPEVVAFEEKWVAWATEQTALLLAGTTRRKSA